MKKRSLVFAPIVLFGGLTGIYLYSDARRSKKDMLRAQETADKYKGLMHLLDLWLMKKQEGKRLIQYFEKNGIESIAIYGMSYIGERLYNELRDSHIEIRFAVDRNVNGIYTELKVFSPKDELPKVDAVIVTPIFYYDEIRETLMKKTDSKIISLNTVLNNI